MAVTIPANDRKAVCWFFASMAIPFLSPLLFPEPLHPVLFASWPIVGVIIGSLLFGALCWAVWRGHLWAKMLILGITVFAIIIPFQPLIEHHKLPEATPRTALIYAAVAVRLVVLFLLTRDLLRRPVATEFGWAHDSL